jgi:predicted NUDIX family NTP pyrophosphohydrolase
MGYADLVTSRRSAGLLLYRPAAGGLEVLLAHPGGPFWAKRDAGAWSIPKGEYEPDEDPLDAARREFAEEFGAPAPADAPLRPLGEVRQRGGKVVTAWALGADFAAETVVSNTVELEWPPRSGRMQSFPEVDRAGWFDVATARLKILAAQSVFLDRLLEP